MVLLGYFDEIIGFLVYRVEKIKDIASCKVDIVFICYEDQDRV